MSLNGFDIANVNGPSIITRALTGSFVICKASEGLSYHDAYNAGWCALARAAGKLVGHYHYAHLANSPTAEADWFLACARPQKGDVLALDFEPYGQNVSPAAYPGWIVAFLQRVNSRTGASCWVYLNDDMGSKVIANATPAQLAVIHNAPLWKARYASSYGSALGWGNITAWQSSANGIDADIFYGDASTWHALGVGGDSAALTPRPATAPPLAPPLAVKIPQELVMLLDTYQVINIGTTDDPKTGLGRGSGQGLLRDDGRGEPLNTADNVRAISDLMVSASPDGDHYISKAKWDLAQTYFRTVWGVAT